MANDAQSTQRCRDGNRRWKAAKQREPKQKLKMETPALIQRVVSSMPIRPRPRYTVLPVCMLTKEPQMNTAELSSSPVMI